MRHFVHSTLLAVALFVIGTSPVLCDQQKDATSVDQSKATESQIAFVRAKVLPLLEARCFECHRNGKEFRGGLSLASRRAMLKGGDSGPAIVPGKPADSLLIEAVRYEGFEMPPRSKMPNEEVRILEKWIADGALWPADLDAEPVAADEHFPLEERRQSHWAWQPIADKPVPAVKAPAWVNDSLDAFVLAKLESNGLTPAVDADRYTIIRRLYFDIIGLPPTVPQVEAFVKDPAEDREAMSTTVERLLESPQFGERWGRHWLDLVRYAETLGHEFDYPLHNAWRYRDYVIRAFNADVPYDQFVREHIAGDLLPNPRRHPTEEYNESVIGTGFWFLHEDKHAPVDVRGEEAAKIDNQIDVFSKTFLGMTVACARCHDHKFDAISTQDYYALSGFLQSSRRQSGWLDPHRRIEGSVAKLRQIRSELQAVLAKIGGNTVDASELEQYALAGLEITQSEAKDEAAKALFKGVSTKRNCNPKTLQMWVDALRRKGNRSVDQLMSLPSILAVNPSKPVATAVSNWKKSLRGVSDSSETTPFADLRGGLPVGWFMHGQAFDAKRSAGKPNLEWRKTGLCANAGEGISSATLSRELHGVLSSPTFKLQHPEILVRVAGQGTRMRVVIDGYLMHEFSGLLFDGARQDINTDGEFRWLRFAGDLHRYQGHRMHLEFLDEGHGWLSVQEIRFANRRGAPPPRAMPNSFNLKLAGLLESGAEKVSQKEIIATWSTAVAKSEDASLALMAAGFIALDQSAAASELMAAWNTAARAIPAPVSVLAICDGTPEDEQVFIRGNHKNPGQIAPRQILTALRDGDLQKFQAGSGRLELAGQILKAGNPLAARVMVNRIWHHLFGAGIVESTDNFGVLGKTPTHPELLDHLAIRFRESGWSIKKMIQAIVLSHTYRMSGQRSDVGDRVDPTNRLLHRARVRRLQGEAVRDAMLAVSGRLDLKAFGTPVPQHLTAFMQGRGRPKQNGPIDGNGRRSIYMAVNRNFLSPLMLAFDVPAPSSTIGKRTSSNVPAQALMLLNNEFVNQQAELWATRLLNDASLAPSEVLHNAWYELFGRPASESEIAMLLGFAVESAANTEQALAKERLITVCHVLLNSKEFLFLR